MRNILIETPLLAGVILFAGCINDKAVTQPAHETEALQRASTRAYQADRRGYAAFPSFVNFGTKVDAATGRHESELRRAWLEEAGWPTPFNYESWKASHGLEDAIALYHRSIRQYESHPYLPTLQQHGSRLILAEMRLLDTDRRDEIEFFVRQLVESQYSGMQLLEFSLHRLGSLGTSETVLSGLAADIRAYYEPRYQQVVTARSQPSVAAANGPGASTGLKQALEKADANMQLNESAYERLRNWDAR